MYRFVPSFPGFPGFAVNLDCREEEILSGGHCKPSPPVGFLGGSPRSFLVSRGLRIVFGGILEPLNSIGRAFLLK